MGSLIPLSKLCYWLLITNKTTSPKNVTTTIIELDLSKKNLNTLRLAVYRPTNTKIRNALLIAPGLDFRGPDDDRMKRLASILASTGCLVYIPYMKDYQTFEIKPDTHRYFFASFDQLLNDPLLPKNKKPTILSISFGSYLAFKLAKDKKRRNHINNLLSFGGYCSWQTTCQSILSTQQSTTTQLDLRTSPVIFNHFVKHYFKKKQWSSVTDFQQTLLSFIQHTWDDDRYLDKKNYQEASRQYATKIPKEQHEFFQICCGINSNTYDHYLTLMKEHDYDYLNPFSNTQNTLHCSVYLAHSQDDKVIPTTEFNLLKQHIPKKHLKLAFLTSLYGHTKKSDRSLFKHITQNIKEISNLCRFLHAIIS